METEKLVEQLTYAESLEDYLEDFGELCEEQVSFHACFSSLFQKKGLRKMDVLERSQVERVYAHELIRGKRRPSRDKVVMMSFGLKLSVPEAQLLLRHSGFSPLTPKVRRDAVLLFGISHGLGVSDTNCMLDDAGLATLD